MAKEASRKGKPRGRTAITGKTDAGGGKTGRHTLNEHKTQVSQSVSAGAGTRRGNRRDTHPVFSTGKTHSAKGQPGPKGRSTRKG